MTMAASAMMPRFARPFTSCFSRAMGRVKSANVPSLVRSMGRVRDRVASGGRGIADVL